VSPEAGAVQSDTSLVARSIHISRRELEEEIRADYSDEESRLARIRRAEERLDRKRYLKAHVKRKRTRESVGLTSSPDSIPINLVSTGRFVHYPASRDDLGGVLKSMPVDVCGGLSSVELTLGWDEAEDGSEVDPFVGRPGSEIFPGVFSPHVLGVYRPEEARIYMHPYIYDDPLPESEVVSVYLRLRMLSTFVHELAHHRHLMLRDTRGRWLLDADENAEIYAERMQDEWTKEYVIPYLEATYPQAVERFGDWMRRHGGISLPLDFVAGDPRSTVRGGFIRWPLGARDAVELLIGGVIRGKSTRETRIEFARDLHHADLYDESLAVLDGILEEDPHDSEALVLMADTFVHQERHEEARRIAEGVLSGDPVDVSAWDVLSSVHKELGEWSNLVHSASRTYDLGQAERDEWWWHWALFDRARAFLELGDFDRLESDLLLLEQSRRPTDRRRAAGLRAVTLLRKGNLEAAFDFASEKLSSQERRTAWDYELVAVRYEAAQRLGRPTEAGDLEQRVLELLRGRGYGDWMDRLVGSGSHTDDEAVGKSD
jgi:tetratricopeptide (TPR) repeat protein